MPIIVGIVHKCSEGYEVCFPDRRQKSFIAAGATIVKAAEAAQEWIKWDLRKWTPETIAPFLTPVENIRIKYPDLFDENFVCTFMTDVLTE